MGRRKYWWLRPKRPWQWDKVQTATNHRSNASKLISHPPIPRSYTWPPEEPLLGLLRSWEKGKEGGRRRRSSLLWEEKEYSFVDLEAQRTEPLLLPVPVKCGLLSSGSRFSHSQGRQRGEASREREALQCAP